jgi:endonuclease/exonuclease/phosphatase family metal-dependent hydrolase
MGAGQREIHQHQAHKWRAYPICPYGSQVKIATWNILHGMAVPEGVIHNDRLAQVAKTLDVDLLAMQEVDFFQERSHFVDQSALVANELGARFISRGISLVGTPGQKWRKFHALDNSPTELTSASEPYYGNCIISRVPIIAEFRLELGRSKVGAPLIVPQTRSDASKPKIKFVYIHDEPRIAHAVHLENGTTIINTHLSFIPGMNYTQLKKIQKWSLGLPGKKILLGDFNLPGKLPSKIMKWRSANVQFTYPSWGAKVQFDHILLGDLEIILERRLQFLQSTALVSDHLPLGVEISLASGTR